ncbi:MAG TPA: nuclear transport factor 2 family protein [Pyrinomonadaceae bacterium]|jgi:hypothetical protein
MKKIGWSVFLFACMCAMTGCGAPAPNAGNAPANANANTAAKPAAAAPTADALLALDKQANDAYFKGDGKFFETFLSDKFVMSMNGKPAGKASVVDGISKVKCDSTDYSVTEPQMTMIDADTYVLTYKNAYNGKCTYDGKPIPTMSPVRAASVFVRNGDKWQGVFHGENPIIDPKNPPKPPAKSPEPKKADDKSTASSNSNSAAPAAPALPAKSANTDAVAAIEKSGWTAWMNKDAKGLDAIIAKNIAIVSGDGSTMNDRAGVIKYWAEMPCKDVKTVDVKDPYGVTLSPTVEMLAFTGVADGTCFDTKNTPQSSVSIYVKEGDAWKLAFAFGG